MEMNRLLRQVVPALLLLLPELLQAQLNVSPSATAIGGCSVLAEDYWSVLQNPAGLAFTKEPVFAFAQQRNFLIKELDVQEVQFSSPVFKTSGAGFAYSRSGYSLYQEQDLSMVWSQRFGEKISGGIQCRYHALKLGEGYGSKSVLLFRAGIIAKLTPAFTVATQMENPLMEGIVSYQQERLPVLFSLGASFKFSEQLKILAEGRQEIGAEIIFCGGLEYRPVSGLVIRGGISSVPLQGSFGFGWRWKKIAFTVSAARHPYLGFSPHLGIAVFLGKKSME
ncbi:hypothetical protein BH11BAC2_BH11BAC2_19850 [soil metagenome]